MILKHSIERFDCTEMDLDLRDTLMQFEGF